MLKVVMICMKYYQEQIDRYLDDKGHSNRLEIEVDGERKHPLPLFLDIAENICTLIASKMRGVYDSIKSEKQKNKTDNDEITKI